MPIRLLFLDLTGTLFQRGPSSAAAPRDHKDSVWYRLMKELGPDALKDQEGTLRQWENGGFSSYLEWAGESARILKKHGLTREQFRHLVESFDYQPGVETTLDRLHGKGVITSIVSGGFYGQARRAQRALRVTHAFAAIDLFWDDRGTLVHWNLFPSDYEGKIDFMRLLMREYKLGRDQCAFVGDGQNDVAIAGEVGTSFAFQAHPKLQQVAAHVIEDFSELLHHLP